MKKASLASIQEKAEKDAARVEFLRSVARDNVSGMVELTMHDKNHKLAGIESVSTCVLINDICEFRRRSGACDGVCAHCYAASLNKAYKNLSVKLSRNYGRLTSHLLTDDEVPLFSTFYGRVESFGDVRNVTHARNYIKIIRNNPRTKFGIWSKNIGIWAAAFKIDGKPENCTFVFSSSHINQRETVPEFALAFTDHVFTVFTPGHDSNCAGIKCMTCLKCYKKDTEFYIDEILR